MTIKQLLKLEIGDAVSIFNEPFTYIGQAKIELDSGHKLRWFYDEEGRMLSIAPQDDELILFHEVDDELEPEEEALLFQGKAYEFNYEDAGNVLSVEGDSVSDEGDRFMFSDYHAVGGEIVRLVENDNTGESAVYSGVLVSEDDVTAL